jgi:hypothetical protein
VEKLPKNQKEYYHNKIRDYEKRTGKSMNVKGVSQFYDYKIEDAEYNFQAALDLMQKHSCYIYNDSLVEEDPRSNGTHWRKYGFAHVNNKTYIYYFETEEWGKELDAFTYRQCYDKTWKAGKLVKTKFPYSIDPGEDHLPYATENKHIRSNFDNAMKTNNILSFESAVHFLNTGRHYITVPENMFSTDDNDPTVGKVKVGIALKNNIPHFYFYEVNKWGMKANLKLYEHLENWKHYPMPINLINESFKDSPERDGFENKHIGSDFDSFLNTNNIELKKDINWAVKMLEAGKMMTREGNRNLTLFPKKYNHAESTITTDDLFAEDWMVVQNKSFKDVLEDLYAGKTIRRKSWHPDFGVGKYANGYGKLIYLDLIADDWEVIDVIAEVNKNQKDHMDSRK